MFIEWSHFLLITAILAISSALHASVGFGFGLLATPLLFLVEPGLVPGPFLATALLLTGLMIWRERPSIDFYGLRWSVIGCAPGILVGVSFLASISADQFSLAFGVILLVAVAMSLGGLRFPMRRSTLLVAGLISGVMSSVGAIGGPPLALVYQDASPERLRSTISGYFLAVSLMTLPSMAAAGIFGWREVLLAAELTPGTLLGFFVSSWLVHRLKGRSLRPAILAISGLSAVSIIIRQFVG
jgi:hypothetical protein